MKQIIAYKTSTGEIYEDARQAKNHEENRFHNLCDRLAHQLCKGNLGRYETTAKLLEELAANGELAALLKAYDGMTEDEACTAEFIDITS